MSIRAVAHSSHPPSASARRNRRARGQSMVEIALVLPLLVTIVVAGLDLARYVAMHTAADAASREATRYASAVGLDSEPTPRYVNCAGIRVAAVEAAPLLDLTASTAVLITYQDGPDDDAMPAGASCPTPPAASDVHRLDRVVVTVTTRFEPTIALLKPIEIISTDRRTIVAEP